MQNVQARLHALVSTMSTFCGSERTTGVWSQNSATFTAVLTACFAVWTSCSFIGRRLLRGHGGRKTLRRDGDLGRFRQRLQVPPDRDDLPDEEIGDRVGPEVREQAEEAEDEEDDAQARRDVRDLQVAMGEEHDGL